MPDLNRDEAERLLDDVQDTFVAQRDAALYAEDDEAEKVAAWLRARAAVIAAMTRATPPLLPIERDEAMDRDYIPLPGGWEIQTKGNGSTFRVLDRNTGERYIVMERHAHKWLTKMARDIRKALTAAPEAPRG